jgi:hypothetical protein
MSQLHNRDLRRRHPLCPACGYDLVATVAASKRICPECGAAFELADLNYEVRKGDWTASTALGRALRVLFVRSLWATAATCGLSIAGAWMHSIGAPRLLPFLIAVLGACLLGLIYSRHLTDQAGFEGPALIIGACVAALATALIGHSAAFVVLPSRVGLLGSMDFIITVLGAWTWIVYAMVMELY